MNFTDKISFEESGLPDKACYRKAFQKSLKAIVGNRPPATSIDEAVNLFRDMVLAPAQMICSLNIAPATEEKLVKIILTSNSYYSFMTDRDTKNLTTAIAMGLQAWSADVDAYRTLSDGMTPEERLMVQVGICGLMNTATEHIKKLNNESTREDALIKGIAGVLYKNTNCLMDAYNAVSRKDFAAIDQLIEEKHERIKKIGDTITPRP